MANPAVGRGEDLIAAGLMLISGPVDGDQLVDVVRVGYERGKGSLQGYAQPTLLANSWPPSRAPQPAARLVMSNIPGAP